MTSTFFVWKPQFSVGIAQIDAGRRWFFDIVNRLHDATARSAPTVQVNALHLELAAYAKTHFANEEELMADAGFPGVDVQRQQHAQFLSQLVRLPLGSSVARQSELALARNWMLEHILGTDREFASWSASKRADDPSATRRHGPSCCLQPYAGGHRDA